MPKIPAQPQQTTTGPVGNQPAKNQRIRRNFTLELRSRKTDVVVSVVYLDYEFSYALFRCKPEEVTTAQAEEKGLDKLFSNEKLQCVIVDQEALKNSNPVDLDALV